MIENQSLIFRFVVLDIIERILNNSEIVNTNLMLKKDQIKSIIGIYLNLILDGIIYVYQEQNSKQALNIILDSLDTIFKKLEIYTTCLIPKLFGF